MDVLQFSIYFSQALLIIILSLNDFWDFLKLLQIQVMTLQQIIQNINLISIMELSLKRRKYRGTHNTTQIHNQYSITTHNTTRNQSLNGSFFVDNMYSLQNTIINQDVRAKASKLLNITLSPRHSVEKKIDISKKQIKVSLMLSPKKKLTNKQFLESFSKRGSLNKTILSKKKQSILKQISHKKSKLVNLEHLDSLPLDEQNKQNDSKHTQGTYHSIGRRNMQNCFTPYQYFSLVFSKMLSNPGKQKIYTFIEELSLRYQKYPQTIVQDIIDMRSLSSKLILALGPKESYKQLKPFQALQVNGQLARMMFHLTNEIACKKYKKYQLTKIYKQIQYGSRRLQFNKFTLRICFQLGQLYKKQNDELNSHAYFTKALKMSIFLNDKFGELKAIDQFGITSYLANKSGQAHFFHQNMNKLFQYQRQLIRQKYSNSDQLQKLCEERQKNYLRNKNYKTQRKTVNVNQKRKKEKFNFEGQQFSQDYQIQNHHHFKQNIRSYIQSPEMRQNVLKARISLNKINLIGKIKRYKNWQASRIPYRFKGDEDGENCSQVMLTHRSLNRINPEYQQKIIEKERKILLELINYYTNDSIIIPTNKSLKFV